MTPNLGHRFSAMSQALREAKRVVVKIGSALLVDRAKGLHASWLQSVADDIAELTGHDKDVIVVSSGAIALGSHAMGFNKRPDNLKTAQAAACIGQINLMNAYQSAFAKHGKSIGQLLLTLADLDGRRSYLNASDALKTLIKHGVVPIINENDATATVEIRVGDNDRLAARVAQMIDADLLILLSDVDGLYTADPRKDPAATHYSVVDAITPEILEQADSVSDTAISRGGMRTKLEAGQIVAACGCAMIVMDGQADNPLARLRDGETHTLFKSPVENRLNARLNWLAGQLGSQAIITVDDGAYEALLKGKSLLPAGIISLRGDMKRGDAVTVKNAAGLDIARGLVNYDGDELDRIKGIKSSEIAVRLGYYARSQTAIHSDNLALLLPTEDTL